MKWSNTQNSPLNSQYIVDTRLHPSNNLAWIKKQLQKLPICQRLYLKSQTMLFKQATSAVRHSEWISLITWNTEYIETEMKNHAKKKSTISHLFLTSSIPQCSSMAVLAATQRTSGSNTSGSNTSAGVFTRARRTSRQMMTQWLLMELSVESQSSALVLWKHISLQPPLGYSWRGLHLLAWMKQRSVITSLILLSGRARRRVGSQTRSIWSSFVTRARMTHVFPYVC